MLVAGSDALLAVACVWAAWTLARGPAAGPVRLLALALGLLTVPSAAGALRFGGVVLPGLTALHQTAADLYALLGFAAVASALFLIPGRQQWHVVTGVAVLIVGGLALAGYPALIGPLASLFILAATARMLRRRSAGRVWLGLSMLGVAAAGLTRVPGLLDQDGRIIGLHLGLTLWVAALATGVRGYSSDDRTA